MGCATQVVEFMEIPPQIWKLNLLNQDVSIIKNVFFHVQHVFIHKLGACEIMLFVDIKFLIKFVKIIGKAKIKMFEKVVLTCEFQVNCYIFSIVEGE